MQCRAGRLFTFLTDDSVQTVVLVSYKMGLEGDFESYHKNQKTVSCPFSFQGMLKNLQLEVDIFLFHAQQVLN